MQRAYRSAVEQWISAMRDANPAKAYAERKKAKAARREFEIAARLQFYATH
jgi:hypothetical protein